MKLIVIALALMAVVAAAPATPDETAETVRSAYNHNPDGSYVFGFDTSNGISRDENGELKEAFDDDKKAHQVVVVRGSYAYIKPDGTPENVIYYADETGFHAEGDSIPKAPVGRR